MSASNTESQSDREILLTRVVDAPRALVWRIWTEPTQVHLWWGPAGFTTTTQEMQVRPGGHWRFTMHGPDGHDYPNLITYLEIEEPARIVYEHGGGDAGLEPVNFKTIVTLEELSPTQTRVTLHSIFPSSGQRDLVVREYGAIEGGKQHLARMAEHAVALLAGESERDEFVLHRVLRAPRALVYDVWTRDEHLAGWFGPRGCTLEVKRLELRPGGVFHYAMHHAGHPPMFGVWTFREVVPNERLVYVASFADEAGAVVRAPFSETWPLHMHSIVTFADHAGIGNGTLLTLRVSVPDATPAERETFKKGYASMRSGWGGTFEQLESYLARRGA